MLRNISQIYDSVYMRYLESSDLETESRLVVARSWGRELLFDGYRVSILQDEKNSGDGWW